MNDDCPKCGHPAYDWRSDTCCLCGEDPRQQMRDAGRVAHGYWKKIDRHNLNPMKHGVKADIHGTLNNLLPNSISHVS